ncbi:MULTISPECIES: cysteine-rich CWC family protein [Pseudomonas]|uniref:Cysteine-rich CWC family protein n=1 Tax=Pseudomonas quercus TaxID=2722792 RepID=A0ABX0YAD0_9PSED|nr:MULTISPECIES: cysteine-rich CWC family protein [Pseudomonas]MBF7141729.1 cysteine-rich CWC family protein [Pseudomonas sp. LY10J]NJP00268.1 cysteine-rich CWC family protein [Pseudomonas quercus]
MPDPSTCPACGCSNQCAMATADTAPCWCFNVTVDAQALAALPDAARGTACLCPRCAAGLAPLSAKPADAP